ncbi:Phosphoglycolate phosphatase [Synechococcus sp. MIT S9509]|uniref:HAD family hydrolase n=1 Tax=unclassified Synechococcus TaxID=2626047 RepID=UPI0007BB9BEF|nr:MULTISPECIES: HAD-IA family hydrolase [unclassified Synechococcus]KZR86425.1 Phosphoglycolate phosphatase [Synechococcus sp. MIT S9504]KZR93437.1 Phosphoglycolate phosphatase [Synechococcus sp. MIT S9509]
MAHLKLKDCDLGPVQGVLFDKDGTLSHSEPRLIELADARIEEAKCRFRSRGASASALQELADLLARTYGRCRAGIVPDGTLAVASRHHNLLSTATVFCQMNLSWPQSLLLAQEVFDQVDNRRQKLHPGGHPIGLLPDAARLLRELASAGIICAVISNDTTEGIQNFLQQHQLNDCISGVWSADHHPAKPDPGAVQELCSQLELKVGNCALIGDADTDLLMARQAGIGLTLGYVAGWHREPTLTAHEHLISHWSELTTTADEMSKAS